MKDEKWGELEQTFWKNVEMDAAVGQSDEDRDGTIWQMYGLDAKGGRYLGDIVINLTPPSKETHGLVLVGIDFMVRGSTVMRPWAEMGFSPKYAAQAAGKWTTEVCAWLIPVLRRRFGSKYGQLARNRMQWQRHVTGWARFKREQAFGHWIWEIRNSEWYGKEIRRLVRAGAVEKEVQEGI